MDFFCTFAYLNFSSSQNRTKNEVISMENHKKAVLLLADGTKYEGIAIGKIGTTGGEICFNTGMTGYQEIYTDPSYFGQIVVNTSSHIGNYGTIDAENESSNVQINGLVVRNFSDIYSRSSADSSLQNYLEKANITGIAEIDTRALVRHIRHAGAMNAIISSEDLTDAELQKRLSEVPNMDGLELSSKVTTKETYTVGDKNSDIRVAVLDYGIKTNILRSLSQRGVFCKVFPAKTSAKELLEFNPTGFFLSNGPGDPAVMDYAINTTKELLELDKPIFGICLGHQILALAGGLSTYKMFNGHRGLNHPVKNLELGTCEITSQNHGFGVDRELLNKQTEIVETHKNLNDKSVAGIRFKNKKAFSVQYHPESSPGPHDSRYLFDQFVEMMVKEKVMA